MLLTLLRYLPRNYLSYVVGKLAHLRIPTFVNQRLINWFVGRYNVNLGDVERDIESFPSLGDFFVRSLKSEVRPIADGFVSPVDGVVAEVGQLDADKLLQAKGMQYSVHDLIGDRELSQQFVGGSYLTLYLAPKDYHGIHAPVDGEVTDALHVPGTLWPVFPQAVASIQDLFPKNERVVTILRSAKGAVAVVKVGALNVGSISVVYDELRSNTNPPLLSDTRSTLRRRYDPPHKLNRGEQLGMFHLGSTVIVITEPGMVSLDEALRGRVVQYGERLG